MYNGDEARDGDKTMMCVTYHERWMVVQKVLIWLLNGWGGVLSQFNSWLIHRTWAYDRNC